MTIIRILACLAAAAMLAACQTVGGGPDPRAVALVQSEGFAASDTAILNRNLEPDDIRTTALYICSEARCGGFGLVAFGVDPATGEGTDEIRALGRMSPTQARKVANRIMRSAGLRDLRVVTVSTGTAGGLQVITIDLRGGAGGKVLHLRISGAYGAGPGQVVAAASERRDVAARLGGRNMLGL
jgi:hypothetical protein